MAWLEAFVEQGVPSSIIHASVRSDNPSRFETGSGIIVSDTRLERSGNKFGKSSFCVLDSCPVVRSLCALYGFQWKTIRMDTVNFRSLGPVEDVQISGNKDGIQLADRVEDNVPMFVGNVPFGSSTIPGFPAAAAEEAPTVAPVPRVREDHFEGDADSEHADEEPLSRGTILSHRPHHFPQLSCMRSTFQKH